MKYLELVKGQFTADHEARAKQEEPYVAYSEEADEVMYNFIPEPVVGPADNEIWYTTVDDQPLYLWYTDPAHPDYNTFKSEDFFETKVVSNTYTDKGIIEFQDAVRIVKYHGIADVYPFANVVSYTPTSTIETIVLPNSVTSIGQYALYHCSSLTTITIPNSVTSIGDCAFDECTSLNSIIFNGTMVEWDAVSKGWNWKSNVPATYVQCTDGQVEI